MVRLAPGRYVEGEGISVYLHLGQNEIIPQRRVIGIFDLDKCSYEKRTRDYLAAAEKEGVVLDISGDLPRSFVVCDHPYHRETSVMTYPHIICIPALFPDPVHAGQFAEIRILAGNIVLPPIIPQVTLIKRSMQRMSYL